MKERPILFSGPMVRAILEGRKTQTRRVMKLGGDIEAELYETRDGDLVPTVSMCPYGQPGDRLWVRETWFPDAPINGWPGDISWQGCGRSIDGVPEEYRKPENCLYRATWTGSDLVWKPSIHMPRWASRILLEIVSVRVEKIQDINDEGAKAEGITKLYEPSAWGVRNFCMAQNPRRAFWLLWETINEPRGFGWDKNPWVWVIEFKSVSPGGIA